LPPPCTPASLSLFARGGEGRRRARVGPASAREGVGQHQEHGGEAQPEDRRKKCERSVVTP